MKQKIKQILEQREKKYIINSGAFPSAVLMPIFKKGGEAHILFTKRTDFVEHHKGKISFPGGKKDEDDTDLLQTALRESFEEIGLHSDEIEILGELDDELTLTSNFVVSPFVGCIPYPYKFELCCEEVKELMEVPIPVLLDRANFREDVIRDGDRTMPAYFYHYGDQIIWGATARILKNFLDLVYADGQI